MEKWHVHIVRLVAGQKTEKDLLFDESSGNLAFYRFSGTVRSNEAICSAELFRNRDNKLIAAFVREMDKEGERKWHIRKGSRFLTQV